MRLYTPQLFKIVQHSAPMGVKTEFRPRQHGRNRRRATVHDNTNSLLYMSQDRPARLHFSFRHGVLCARGLLALFLLALADPASAQQDTASVPNQSAESQATRIEVDDEAGVIRFFIGGQETMRLDAAGLHVRESIDYGGTITDHGTMGFDERLGWKEYERLQAEGRDAR